MSLQKQQAQKLYKLLCREEEDIQQGLLLLETLISDEFIFQYFSQKVYVKPNGNIYHNGRILGGNPLHFDTAVHILTILFTEKKSLKQSIRKLDLSKFSNKEMLPMELGELTNLEELHINSASPTDKPTVLPLWLENLPNLQRLSICGWNITQIPTYLEHLKYLRIRKNFRIKSIPTAILLKKSKAFQLAFLELYESTNRHNEKESLILEHLELLDENYLSVNKKSQLYINNDFLHGPLSFSSRVLFAALDFGYTINIEKIEIAEIDSRYLHYIKKSLNIRQLTLNVENTEEIIDLNIFQRLRYLNIHNLPRILQVSSIPDISISGDTVNFQELRVRVPEPQVYKGFFHAFNAYFRSRWSTGLHNLTSLNYHKDYLSLPKAYQSYILEKALESNLKNLLHDILDNSPSLQKEMLHRLGNHKHRIKGKWKNYRYYLSCWEYFYSKGLITDSNIYVKSNNLPVKNMEIKNLYVHYVDKEPLNFNSMQIDFLKIRGEGSKTESLQVLQPLKCSKLNIENVKIPNEFWNFVPKDIKELSLVSIDVEDLPNLAQFSKLQTLKLINCGLTEVFYLPSTLTSLNISSNPLTNIPDGIFYLTNLKTLHMSKCNFTQIPAKIAQLEHLTYLSMCSSLVSDLTPITTLKNLQKLRIGFALPKKHPRHIWSPYPKVTHRPQIVPMLPKGLGKLKELYVHDLLCIEKHAYLEHTLDILDITNTTSFVGLHMIKEFGHIKSLLGGNTYQTISRDCLTTRTKQRYIVDYERFHEYKLPYAMDDIFYQSSKIERGIQYYQKLQSKSDKMG